MNAKLSRHERNRLVIEALKKRHEGQEWAFFTEVPDGTGSSSRRRADGIAMNLWPSRGLELHGFEVKVDRTDWRNEQVNPEKAESLARFCERWWLVIDDLAIIKDLPVPPPWGILLLDGGKLKMHRDAAKLDAVPITRSMVASLLRKAANDRDTGLRGWVSPESVRDEVLRQVEQREAARDSADGNAQLRARLKAYEEWGEKIAKATGCHPLHDWTLPQIERVVHALGHVDPVDRFEREADQIERAAKDLRAAARLLRKCRIEEAHDIEGAA